MGTTSSTAGGMVYLGRYRAERLLGAGGMGRVFLGQELSSGRVVVIKVMHPHVAGNPRFRQSFRREMLLMKRFRHPHAVELYDASTEEADTPCIIMEYVPGITLEALLRRHRRLDPNRLGRLLGPICNVLHAAHTVGIIHRDLTPANIMVMQPDTPTEQIKVMDFGLARLGSVPYIPLEKLTGAKGPLAGGTPDYVCPEQIRGEEVDGRGDLYSLGVLLFKALTGFLPFEQVTETADILWAHLHTPPPRFAELGVMDVPAAVEAVVQACLRKQPAERPADALQVARLYGEAIGQVLLTEEDLPSLTPLTNDLGITPQHVVDCLEAWMPEPVAVVKLRGFIQDVGGEILESEPGLIRFRLRLPSASRPTPPSWWERLGLVRRAPTLLPCALLELILEKVPNRPATCLRLTVQMRPENAPELARTADWQKWCQDVCRELRAYLIGH